MYRGPVGAAGRLSIDRAVRAARAGEPVGEHLEALGLRRAPRTAPGPDVDTNDGTRGTLPRTAAADPRAVLGDHVCPRGVCSRREGRGVDGERPVCEIFDLTLRFEPEN